MCDLETSRMGAPYIYDISRLRVNVFILHFGVFGSVILSQLVNKWLSSLELHFSPRRPAVNTTPVHVRFVIRQVALGQIFL